MDFVNLDTTFLSGEATKHMCWRVVVTALLLINSANMISAENNRERKDLIDI